MSLCVRPSLHGSMRVWVCGCACVCVRRFSFQCGDLIFGAKPIISFQRIDLIFGVKPIIIFQCVEVFFGKKLIIGHCISYSVVQQNCWFRTEIQIMHSWMVGTKVCVCVCVCVFSNVHARGLVGFRLFFPLLAAKKMTNRVFVSVGRCRR